TSVTESIYHHCHRRGGSCRSWRSYIDCRDLQKLVMSVIKIKRLLLCTVVLLKIINSVATATEPPTTTAMPTTTAQTTTPLPTPSPPEPGTATEPPTTTAMPTTTTQTTPLPTPSPPEPESEPSNLSNVDLPKYELLKLKISKFTISMVKNVLRMDGLNDEDINKVVNVINQLKSTANGGEEMTPHEILIQKIQANNASTDLWDAIGNKVELFGGLPMKMNTGCHNLEHVEFCFCTGDICNTAALENTIHH
ncbi:unnamed protein product, partial [Meganyctiphanes norvegica]